MYFIRGWLSTFADYGFVLRGIFLALVGGVYGFSVVGFAPEVKLLRSLGFAKRHRRNQNIYGLLLGVPFSVMLFVLTFLAQVTLNDASLSVAMLLWAGLSYLGCLFFAVFINWSSENESGNRQTSLSAVLSEAADENTRAAGARTFPAREVLRVGVFAGAVALLASFLVASGSSFTKFATFALIIVFSLLSVLTPLGAVLYAGSAFRRDLAFGKTRKFWARQTLRRIWWIYPGLSLISFVVFLPPLLIQTASWHQKLSFEGLLVVALVLPVALGSVAAAISLLLFVVEVRLAFGWNAIGWIVILFFVSVVAGWTLASITNASTSVATIATVLIAISASSLGLAFAIFRWQLPRCGLREFSGFASWFGIN